MPARRTPRSAVLGLTVGALTAGGLATVAAPAAAASTTVVINEVYGGGGASSGTASYSQDFVELANRSSTPAALSGWSLQYASATGTTWSSTALSGSIPAGGTLLVALGSAGSVGAPLPTPDATGSLNLAQSAGKVALSTGTARLGCGAACATDPAVRDLVAYGASTGGEGAPVPALSTTTSAGRTASPDSDSNATDFTVGAPHPQAAGVSPDPTPSPEPEPLTCTTTARSIGSVQGAGAASPLDRPTGQPGVEVVIAGTVVGDLQDGGFNGVYVQDGGDGDDATSDGIFVYTSTPLGLGDEVVVRGTVEEYQGLTELIEVTVLDCGDGDLPRPAMLPMPSGDAEREALEGMLVATDGELTVTELFDLSRYGQLLLASGGRLVTPTEAAAPGPAGAAVAAENAARSIVLDDARTTSLSTAGEAPPFLTTTDPVRVGDGVDLQPVVLTYGFGAWALQPADGTAEGTTFPAANPRPTTAPEVGGDLKVGDFNVLNYFVDFPSEFGDDARGAANAEELARQQAKIVSAITALDADVLTLHEIENSAVLTPSEPYRAVETLLGAIEAEDGHDWAYVPAHEDTDVITNAIVYRADRVTPVGTPAVPSDLSAFDNARSPIAQTFDARGEVFTIIANHLKSKGSSCGAGSDDPSVGGAGNCNGDRVAQAQALVAFAQERAEAAGDPDVLLTGDFNAYRYEAPVDVVRAAGYADMAPLLAPGEYSYVFDGGSGSLDHVFASPSMADKLTGLGVWDVNAVESGAYQYDGYEPLFASDVYRASDHNPTLFGIEVAATAAISDAQPLRGEQVTVSGTGFAPGDRVTASLPSRNRGQLGAATADGDGQASITFQVPVVLGPGDQEVQLTGTSGETASTGFRLRPLLEELLARLIRWWGRG